MGDFNAKHPMWYNTSTNNLGEQLSDFINLSDFTIANNQMHTYKESVIDLTLIKGCRNLISNWSAHPEIFVNTDHTMILFDLSVKVEDTSKPRWKTKSADWEVWKAETRKSYDSFLENINLNQEIDINKDYSELKNAITELGELHIGKSKSHRNSK